jgi:proteasome accessory factor C
VARSRARRASASRTEDRLRRLLAIVPYVVRNPGARIDEVSRLFGVPETALTQDLNLLFLTGLPPYTPADLIEVEIEGGRVWIRMAEHFARPVRLTRPEARALYLRGSELLGAPGLPEAEALRSALDKLAGSLGPDSLGDLQVEVGEAPAGEVGHLETVREAAARRERLEIDYYSGSRDEVTTRRIDPEHVFSAIGNWYVVAWDHRSDAERLFRVDRIRAARPSGERFEPRGLLGQGRELYTPTGEDIRVRLRVGPGARWIAEYYAVEEATEGRDGVLELTLPTRDLAWMAKLILRLGGQAEILEPPELRDLVRRAAEETLSRYR